MECPSYSSIYTLGHKAVKNIFDSDVTIEEKVDGSQFSARVSEDGKSISYRSRGANIQPENPNKLFAGAVATFESLFASGELHAGWTYRGECLCKPKHNVLAYDRKPDGDVVIFDIDVGNQDYMPYNDKKAEAAFIGLECVPLLFSGKTDSQDKILELLQTTSFLGGQKIEGVVIKNYNMFGADKKTLMAKYVSEAFKEVHRKHWGEENQNSGDILHRIALRYRSEARWNKAIQHMSEAGTITDSPKDIGGIIKEVIHDVYTECAQDIRNELFGWAWRSIAKQLCTGLPEWYKQKLLDKQFEGAVEKH